MTFRPSRLEIQSHLRMARMSLFTIGDPGFAEVSE